MEGESSSSSKKRKIIHQDRHDSNNIDDEEKMEKFFALIKSIRDARHRLTNGPDASADDAADGGDDGKKRKVVWKPSFQREDFMDEAARELKDDPRPTVTLAAGQGFVDEEKQLKEDLPVTLAAGHIARNIDERQEEESCKEAIDLRLSL
ncbi:hypothetical protein HS088_TW17G00991 [Tripterygium wilfordii]|uniref:Uncharacterized protein n=1 Tax=Tripterygium wilfordii TaxID=458696 RepID=A0A7J7CHB4_TRIWF|nr:uncharacterized protein LOC119982877 [Tripterygium wilfordii]KAF5733447.1 hypothetical protein HS088_TW17G00991 [Tripterygium wilfordii]